MKKIIIIILSILVILGIGTAVFFLIKNNDLKKEVSALKSENDELKQEITGLDSKKTSLEEKNEQILEKAKNYLISEGRTIIPESGVSCSDKPEECLNHWTNKLTSGAQQKNLCDFTNNEVGCGRNDFKILSPNGGESFCIGGEVTINWKAPADAEAVTVKLRESGLSGTTYTVGTFPASQNETGTKNGEGTTAWKTPAYVKDSMVYKLWINMIYKGSSVNDSSDDFFTVQNCQG